MAFEPLKSTDITSSISQLKGAYPQGAARKALAQILKDFTATSGADLNTVDVIDLNGKTMSILNFVKQVDGSNDLSMASLLQKACKHPDILAKDVLGKVEKQKSDAKCFSGAPPVRITLDLRIVMPKQKVGNVAAGQGPVTLQEANNPTKTISETGKAANIEEKDNGIKLVYSEKWVVKVLLNELGYINKI